MDLRRDITLSRRPLAGFVVIGLAWGMFSALVPPVKAQIGASDGLYGGLVLVASIGAIMAMWLAPLAFRLTGRWAVVLGCGGVAIGFLLTTGANGPAVFMLGMGLAAMGTGVVDVLINAEIAEIEAQEDRALMNLNHGLYSFAFAGGAVLAGVLREAGWTPLQIQVVMATGIALLSCFMWTRKLAEAQGEDGATAGAFPKMLVFLGGLVTLAAFLTEASTEGWSALHLERTLGGSPAEGALGPAVFGLAMGIGRLCGHLIASRLSELRLIFMACVLCAIGLTLAGLSPNLWLAYLGFAVGGLGISVVVPLCFALIGRHTPADQRLRAISRAAVMGYGAFFFGPPLMGLISEAFGLRVSFITIGGLLLVVGLVLVPAFGRAVGRG